MKQHNNDIINIMDKVLQQHATSIRFEDVWNKKLKSEGWNTGFKNTKIAPLIALITILALFMVGFTGYKVGYNIFRNIDKVDYPFVDDPRVIGKWEAVDFVNKTEDFNPDEKTWKSELYLSSLIFIKGGKMLASIENGNIAYTPATWTREIVINEEEKTASKYLIEEINGNEYMFFEWKSGDYVFRNETPSFYVLKKADSEDYSDYQVKSIREDNVDYPFVDDDNMKGKWQSVDFVETIDSFKPEGKYWLGDLYLLKLNFKENGKLMITTTKSTALIDGITWTKGWIIDTRDKTASSCTIKEINGEKYMFYEWKSGDYVYRGMTPWYYVLKKVE